MACKTDNRRGLIFHAAASYDDEECQMSPAFNMTCDEGCNEWRIDQHRMGFVGMVMVGDSLTGAQYAPMQEILYHTNR